MDKSTFQEYVRTNRFSSNGKTDKLLKLIDVDTGTIKNTPLIVVHPPYPARGQEDEVRTILREVHIKANATGYGCGKTNLFESIIGIIEKEDRYNVVAFLDNRDVINDGISFYYDIFLEGFQELKPHFHQALKHRINRYSTWCKLRTNQLALLINSAAIPFAALLTYVLTLLGFDAFKYLADPDNQQIVGNLATWTDQNRIMLLVSAVIGLIIWILYAWGSLQRDEKTSLTWRELSLELEGIKNQSDFQERFKQEQEQILRYFATPKHPLVVFVDDVDVIDNHSFGKLIELHKLAEKSDKYGLKMILGYNPWNPTLFYSDRRLFQQELALEQINEQGWFSLELDTVTFSDVRSWLWSYYDHKSIIELVDELRKNYEEVRENPSLLLAFLNRFDKQSIHNDIDVEDISYSVFRHSFESFLNRDRRVARDIEQKISAYENGAGAIELLKYILAYKKAKIPVEHIKKTMLNSTEYEDFDSIERILLSDDLNILQKQLVSGNQVVYVFRQTYLQLLLTTGWKHWRQNSSNYYNDTFLSIHKYFKSVDDNPDLALEVAPSRLAVDVLQRQGDHYYKYFGSSDAGFALRYYGLTRGGALGKWFSLCKDAIDNGENLWGLVYWKGDARFNPKRGYSQESDRPWVFAPELVLTAGLLYWLNGEWETAELIWSTKWQHFLVELQRHNAPNPEIAKRVNKANTRIQSALAEMYYEIGDMGHWDRAKKICQSLQETSNIDFGAIFAPDLTLALIDYYQKAGVANCLNPYTFLTPDDNHTSRLIEVSNLLSTTDVNRLRALNVVAESLWQILWPCNLPLPRTIHFRDVIEYQPNSDTWEMFGLMYSELQVNLDELIKFRNSQRHGRLPGGRINDGDLLYWEAFQWITCARYFCLEAILLFGKWPLLRTPPTRKFIQRIRSYQTIATSFCDFCLQHFPNRKQPDGLRSSLNELERISRQISKGENDDERLRKKSENLVQQSIQFEKKTELKRLHNDAKQLVENLYQIVWSYAIDEAQNRLRLADSIYRQLGYQQGMASVRYARGLLAYQFSTFPPTQKQPNWVEVFLGIERYCNGEAGFHLDSLKAHLFVAQWAEAFDFYLGVQSFLAAEKWSHPENLGLPKAISGEINYRTGRMIGNMDASPFSNEFQFEVLDKARDYLSNFNGEAKCISAEELSSRHRTIHWWYAELYRRQATSTLDPAEQEILWEKVLEETDYVLKISSGEEGFGEIENLALLVRGEILIDKGYLFEGYELIKQTQEYFHEAGNAHDELQALNSLISIRFSDSLEDKRLENYRSNRYPEYCRRMEILVEENLEHHVVQSAGMRSMLYRSSRLLGILYSQYEEANRLAIKWLNTAFDILQTLGLFGLSILLDDFIRPLYEKNDSRTGLEYHKQRIMDAAQKIEPSREKVAWYRISQILRQYSSINYIDSEHIKTKKECLAQARKALELTEPEANSAITFLTRARKLINLKDPEDIDIDILRTLVTAYYRQNNPDEADLVEHELVQVQSVIQARDFWNLAQYFKSSGGDYDWALEVAMAAIMDNEYSQMALAEHANLQLTFSDEVELESDELELEITEVELDTTTIIEEQTNTQDILSKASSDFEKGDCYLLLHLLENNIRDLIESELSSITPRWWRQRIPPDVRTQAHKRKQGREMPYLGRAQQELPVSDYLDFGDYDKIITMKANWNDVFRAIFVRKDVFLVKLGEIRIFRNDIAHMRELPRQDRESFVTNARALLNSIHQYNTAKATITATSEVQTMVEDTENKISILFLSSDPSDASRLRLGEEFREIKEEIRSAKLRDRFRLELPQLSARPEDISQAFLDIHPNIVHFSGHGASSGALIFENEAGESHPVPPDALAALFEQFLDNINCVLLNACYSKIQAEAIAQSVDYVIGMKHAITDKAAIAFTIGFYQALGAGRDFEDAYKFGCIQIRLQNIPDHLVPVLVHDGKNQSCVAQESE